MELIKKVEPAPTYFELMIVFVLWSFVRHKVDYAVLETGMGGLLDGTNVVTRADKVCVITDIGLDHTHVLGNSVGEIAQKKAGIIHQNNHVFMYKQNEAVMDQITSRVEEKNAQIHSVDEFTTCINGVEYASSDKNLIAKNLQLDLLPLFQRRNYVLAHCVANFIAKRDSIRISESFDPLGVTVPGRMDTKQLKDGSILIMDGAHNGQKVTTFVESFVDKYPSHKAHVLLALKEGKEYTEVLEALEPITESLIVTTFSTSQDLPAVAQDPQVIADHATSLGLKSQVISDHVEAYETLRASDAKFKLVVGSFYLLGQIRK